MILGACDLRDENDVDEGYLITRLLMNWTTDRGASFTL